MLDRSYKYLSVPLLKVPGLSLHCIRVVARVISYFCRVWGPGCVCWLVLIVSSYHSGCMALACADLSTSFIMGDAHPPLPVSVAPPCTLDVRSWDDSSQVCVCVCVVMCARVRATGVRVCECTCLRVRCVRACLCILCE